MVSGRRCPHVLHPWAGTSRGKGLVFSSQLPLTASTGVRAVRAETPPQGCSAAPWGVVWMGLWAHWDTRHWNISRPHTDTALLFPSTSAPYPWAGDTSAPASAINKTMLFYPAK